MEPKGGADIYLNEVLAHVRWKRAHGAIHRELFDHIEDARLGFLAQGMSDGEAQSKAVTEMGDAAEVGARFDAAYRPAKNYGVWVPFLALFVLGFILRGYAAGGAELSVFSFLIPIVFLGFCFLRFERLVKLAWPLYGAYLLALLVRVSVTLFAPAVRGLTYFALYLPILFPALYALLIYRMRGRGIAQVVVLGAAFMAQMLPLLYASPFKAVVLAFVCLIELLYAVFSGWLSCKKWHAALVILVPTILFIFLAMSRYHYGFARRSDTLLPGLDWGDLHYSDHYFDRLTLEILAKTSWFGAANASVFSESAQLALFRRPRGTFVNDYLLVWLSARFGRIVLVAVGGLFAALFFFTLRAALRQKNKLYRLTSLGITLHLFMQFAGYFLANLGFNAFFSYPLPFVSSGDAAMLVNAALMGLLFSMLYNGPLVVDGAEESYLRWRLKLVKEMG